MTLPCLRALLLTLIIIGAQLCNTSTAQSPTVVQTFSTSANKVVLDGSYVIVGNVDVQVWNNNAATGTKVRDIVTGYTVSEPILSMCALNGFLYTVTSNSPKAIRSWNYVTGAEMWRVPAVGNSHDDELTDIAVSSNGVYTSSTDGTIKQWNITTGALVATVQQTSGPSGFVAPVRKLFVDQSTSRLYAAFGRYMTSNGVGRATLLPSGDFDDITTTSGVISTGVIGNWTTSTSNSVFAYNPISLGSTVVAPSGRLVVLLNHPTGIVTAFAKQTLSVVPGNLYQFRYWYGRHSNRPLPTNCKLSFCGTSINAIPVIGAGSTVVRNKTTVFQATGKSCIFEILSTGCTDNPCNWVLDFIELILVQRYDNIDNMEVVSVTNGGFESITATTTNVTYSGAFGAWTKTAGTGTVGIAKVGSANCFNLPAAGGSYALWMETVANSDTTVSQNVALVSGATYMVRWHYAMRQISGASTANPVSSAINVSLCGTVVAGNYIAPSLLFEQASSSMITPIGTTTTVTCALTITILQGASTLRSLLIDEVELVRVRNPNLVPSGGFEGLTDTTTSWSVYPGSMGNWTSSGDVSGSAAIARLPSTQCDNIRSIASPYVLWMQSSTSAPGAAVSVSITTLVTGSTYVVRWLFARRILSGTTLDSPSLSVTVFGTTVASGRIPASDVFATDQSSEFIASATTTTLTLTVSVEATAMHMLIDDVMVVLVKAVAVAGAPPLVKEYTIGASSLTPLRDYTLLDSWLATLAAGTVADFASLNLGGSTLYTGMSLSVSGTTCHVLKYNTLNGAYSGSMSMACNGSSVRSVVTGSGHMLIGHVGAITQLKLEDGSLVRVLDWSPATTLIMDMVANGWYFFASGNDSKALKWRLPEWVTTTTLTRTTTTTTTTTRTTTSTTSTSTTSTSTSTTSTSTTSTSTTSTSTTSTSTTSTSTTSTSTTTSTTITPTPTQIPDGKTPEPGSGSLSELTIIIISGAGTFVLLAIGIGLGIVVRDRYRRQRPTPKSYDETSKAEQPMTERVNPLFTGEYTSFDLAASTTRYLRSTNPANANLYSGILGLSPITQRAVFATKKQEKTKKIRRKSSVGSSDTAYLNFVDPPPEDTAAARRERRRSFQPYANVRSPPVLDDGNSNDE